VAIKCLWQFIANEGEKSEIQEDNEDKKRKPFLFILF